MKRFFQILSVVSAFSLIIAESYAEGSSGTPIELEKNHYGGTHDGPSRAPGVTSLSLTIEYDVCNSTLVFYDKNGDSVTYCIYNDESMCMMQGMCCFDEEGLYSAYIGALQSGTYCIAVQINGVEFWGTFEIK